MASDDDRIGYIKESLDGLHEKVDVLFKDADVRLKSLEMSREHGKGMLKGMGSTAGVVAGFISAASTTVASYYIYHTK